jgi:hypothetical protein
MTTTVPRRRFFVTAGLGAAGALTVPAAFLSGQTPSRDDAVMHHVGKELARLYKLQRRRNLHAEHYESVAANLRLLAMLYPDIRAEARKPRKPHDHRRRAREAEEVRKAFGVDISTEPEPAPLTAAEEARVRGLLSREGLGPTLLKMADAAEAKAARMARTPDARPFRNAQWSGLFCNFQPEIEVASQVICDLSYAGIGGAQVVVACRVSMIVVVVWRWIC